MSADQQSAAEVSLREAVSGLAPDERAAFFRAFLMQVREEHQRGNLSGAEAAYRSILQIDPANADALHLLGLLKAQTACVSDAITLLRRAVEQAPAVADFHVNLGNAFRLAGQFAQAAAAYRSAIAIDGQSAAGHLNLANVLKRQGRLRQAAKAAGRAAELAPDDPHVRFTLADIYAELDDWDRSIAEYRQTLYLAPGYFEAYGQLARLLYRRGEVDQARGLVRDWLRIDPASPRAVHMLASLTGENVPARASEAYIRATFDGFAETFDETLGVLEYRAPQLVVGLLGAVIEAPRGDLDVVDGGCGTGLCGPLLRPYARRLVGVDLSPPMLLRAQARGSYDELLSADLTAFLHAARGSWDIIVAADVLVYFGDLSPVLTAAVEALRPGGHLAFTVEHLDDDLSDGLRLNPHGRYSHTARYVAEAARATGLSLIASEGATLRAEGGNPVAGLVILARRPD